MRVLLINLPYYRLLKIKHRYFPLGLAYLAASAKNGGYQVRIYNMEKDFRESFFKKFLSSKNKIKAYKRFIHVSSGGSSFIWKEFKKQLLVYQPQVVGISVWTAVYPLAKKAAEIIKKINPDIKVVIGGIHPTVCDQEVISNENFDFVVRGEGEVTFLELLNALAKKDRLFSEIKGITYSDREGIKKNPERPPINDIDSLSLPDKGAMLRFWLHRGRDFGNVITSRGCPYYCSFCSSHRIWTRRVRFRDVKLVFSEIEKLYRQRGVRFFTIFDDTFTLQRKRCLELCGYIKDAKIKINWFAHARADNLDREYLSQLKSAGCFALQIGIESGSQALLDKMNKSARIDKFLTVRKLLKENGILFWATILIGHPRENEEDLRQTYSLLKELKPDLANINTFIPYPGSQDGKDFFSKFNFNRWEYFSPQNPFINFSGLQPEKWSYWRKKIELLADSYNYRSTNSFINFWKLYSLKLK